MGRLESFRFWPEIIFPNWHQKVGAPLKNFHLFALRWEDSSNLSSGVDATASRQKHLKVETPSLPHTSLAQLSEGSLSVWQVTVAYMMCYIMCLDSNRVVNFPEVLKISFWVSKGKSYLSNLLPTCILNLYGWEWLSHLFGFFGFGNSSLVKTVKLGQEKNPEVSVELGEAPKLILWTCRFTYEKPIPCFFCWWHTTIRIPHLRRLWDGSLSPNFFEACRMPFWKIELPGHGTRVAWWHLVAGKLQEGDINDGSMWILMRKRVDFIYPT